MWHYPYVRSSVQASFFATKMAASTRGWTDRATSALLENLKTRESLRNTKCESYKNRNTKKKHYDANSSNIERRLYPRPNPPSSTFPSFFHLVNNKKCSYSRYNSCLPSTNRRHLCSTLRQCLVIVHVSAGQSHFWRQWINTD